MTSKARDIADVASGTNTAVGEDALENNTASESTAVGYQAGYANTGTGQTFIGKTAGFNNTTGTFHTVVGHNAMYANTTGTNNTAMGHQSLRLNTSGSFNTSIGLNSLYSNTTASNNTAVGYQAGYTNTSSGYNTFVGYQSGLASNHTADAFANNTFVGALSGSTITTGVKNTVLGLYNGNQNGLDIRTSSNNIVLSDGDGNPRGVFDSSGNFMVGAVAKETQGVTLYGTGANGFYIKTTGTCGYLVTQAGTGGAGNFITLYSDTSIVGAITTNGTSTSYETTSDYRLKENVVELTGATTRLKQLNPSRFNFIADADTTVDGFIAHEVQSVVPEAITGTKDAVDDEGNPVYQGIDQSKLVPLLVATIQELEARITALEAN